MKIKCLQKNIYLYKISIPFLNTIIYFEGRNPPRGMNYISWTKDMSCILIFFPLKRKQKEAKVNFEYTPLSNIEDNFHGLNLNLESL